VTFDPGSPLSPDLLRWLSGEITAIVIAAGAWRVRSLSSSGAVAAALLGTIIVGAGGWWAGALLVAFFVTSSALSRIGHDHTVVATARGSRRDAVQVAANGGVAGLCALLALGGNASWWMLALAGSLAAANADTWSTEIGRTSTRAPRLVTSGRRVPPGTSGAVSARGTAGALAGGALLGLLAALGATQGWIEAGALAVFPAVGLAGFAGSLFDSLLGATIQHQRWCPACDTQTERAIHRCGTPARHLRGWRWVTNDVVNLACIASGALLAPVVTLFLDRLA
jgi:uncharacterized protein (TIGR00297 family)